ncbi:hypothetical protein [Nitrosopumilus sp. S6]
MLIISTMMAHNTYAQEPKSIGYDIMPKKLVEGTEGILQIYGLKNNVPHPNIIRNLVVTSLDQNIIKISDIKMDENNFISSIKLKAIDAGNTKIAIASPGFSSVEFPITVYDVKQGEQQLLIKTVPDTFTINGPTKGYFAVELADIDSNPTLAKQDTVVSLTTSNLDTIDLINNQVTIKQGEYFAVGEFEVKKPGEVIVYADNSEIESDSATITVNGYSSGTSSTNEKGKIQLYVIPNKISNFATSSTFAIVQLLNSEGMPVKATESIPISLNIHHEDAKNNRTPDISTPEALIIPQGYSTGYAKLSVKAGLQETYDVSISAQDYFVSESAKLETVFTGDIQNPQTKFETIPIPSSGSEELIGVLYPADGNGVSLINTKTIDVEIYSSNKDALSISNDRIDKADGAKLIFGKLGYVKPDKLEVIVVGKEKDVTSPIIHGPGKTELSLIAEPLVSKVLPTSNFPMMLYFTDNSGANWYFPKTSNLFMSPNEFVKTDIQAVSEGQSVVITNSHSVKEGKDTLNFEVSEYTTNVEVDTNVVKPSKIELSYSNHLLSDMKNRVSLQILDDSGNPMFANHDMNFKIVSNDDSVKIPETVTVKKETYNSFFEIVPSQTKTSEIAILASGFPLAKFNLNSIDIKPSLTISTVNSVDVGNTFDLVVDAKIANTPLSNVKLEWDVQGAEIQEIKEFTDNAGKAKISLVAEDSESIQVKVTTHEFDDIITASKEIITTQANESVQKSQGGFGGNELGLILIPGIVIGGGILIRKKSLLEPISERFPIVERVLTVFDEIIDEIDLMGKASEIKEKIPIIKDR